MVSTRTMGLGPGLHFDEEYAEDCIATGAAFSQYDVVAFDVILDSATDNDEGETDSGLVIVVTPAAADTQLGIFGVVMHDVASGGKCKVLVKGVTKAILGGTLAPSVRLQSEGAGTELITAATTGKVIGIALDTGSATLPTRILFDGINGFGTGVA